MAVRLEMLRLRISSAMIKRRGERGSPCHSPHFMAKKPKGSPSIITEPFELQIQSLIKLIQSSQKVKCLRDLKRKPQFNLSKAFEISNFRLKEPPAHLWLSF